MSEPYAHLPAGLAERIEANYEKSLVLLRERLDTLSDLAQREQGEHWQVEVATSLFAYGVYGNGCAVLTLYRADIGRQLPAIVRAQFEAVVKSTYCKYFPKQAADFLASHPFERWMIARGAILSPGVREGIDADCLAAVRRDFALLEGITNAREIFDGKLSLSDKDKKTIAERLDFDDLASLMRALDKIEPGWDTDLYATIYRLGSADTHHSVTALENALHKGSVETFRFDADQHYEGAADYCLQSENYLLGMIGRLDVCFPDAARSTDEAVLVFSEHQAIVQHLRDAGLQR